MSDAITSPKPHSRLPEDFMLDLMGKVVLVLAELRRTREDDGTYAWCREQPKHRGPVITGKTAGWVVGFRWLQQGKIEPGCESHYGIDGWDPGDSATFKETGPRVPCLLVAYWPTMKPVRVPLDGFEYATDAGLCPIPVSPARAFVWTDRWREMQRDDMAQHPRDAKGRWTKL